MIQYTRQFDKKFRGGRGVWLRPLNKKTGCKSRTVPPLYVPMAFSFDESRSLGLPREGRAAAATQSCKHESEDLRNGFSPFPRDYGKVRLSQKNGCGTEYRCRSFRIFRR